jgi:glycerophosphoryl diester phosphodiesterase
MGAGLIECDVTFTRDRQLVCRHSQCDLHSTTDILARPELAGRCAQPFVPADPAAGKPASARCCTSDLTVAEFKTLCARMDVTNPEARSVSEYLAVPPGGNAACNTVMTHRESIEWIGRLGGKYIPELKTPSVPMPFDGDYTQARYAQQLIDEYVAAGVPPGRVFPQSLRLEDVAFWLRADPAFGANAVYLDGRASTKEGYGAAIASLPSLVALGVRTLAPPLGALVRLDANGVLVASEYAVAARRAGLELLTWTFDDARDGYVVLDVLARQVGVRGVFSDWPASVTYYANCMGL